MFFRPEVATSGIKTNSSLCVSVSLFLCGEGFLSGLSLAEL